MGEDPRRKKEEAAALSLGLDLGLTLIDTAEMYGNGGAEEVVADAIRGRRDEVFLVSKVLPQHADRRQAVTACEASLRRLKTDRIDLYLLHWREEVPLEETLAGFADLVRAGKIRSWGVSNFDIDDMRELVSLKGGEEAAANQVLYNPARRGIEWDLLPWCRERRVPVMAYSPFDQGALKKHPGLEAAASRHRASPAQIVLAWLLRQGVIAIPKAGIPEHVRENRAAADILLVEKDLKEIDAAFPPPRGRVPLETA